MGLMPLMQDMPIRITQTLPDLKQYGLFKNTRGKIFNWTLADSDQEAVRSCTCGDLVLQHMPTCLFVRIEKATWQQHPNLPPGVAVIRPTTQHWKLEQHGTATVARRGFPIACDYAGTAHSFMGATLSACSLDLGFWDSSSNRDGQLSAYMCLSRVRRTEDLCVARPFSPNLLAQGELIGPDTFLQVHRKTLTLSEAKQKFEADVTQRKRGNETLLFCRRCTPRAPNKEKQGLLPMREFTTENTWDPRAWLDIVSLGMDRICTQCRNAIEPKASPPSAAAGSTSAAGIPCAYCGRTKLPTLGFCQTCFADVRLACAACDTGMKLKTKTLADFNPEEIQRRRKTKEMRKARCKMCELHRPNTAKGKAGHCRMCEKLITVTNLHQYTAATNDGICRTCWHKMQEVDKATANVCPQCSQPLKKGTTPGSWCEACAYPPCAGCKKVSRSKKGTNHAKHRPFWRCQACAQDICQKCHKKPVGHRAGPAPQAFCPACAETAAQCEVCKKPLQAQKHGHFLHATVAVAHRGLRHTTSTMPRSCPNGPAKRACKSTSLNQSNPRATQMRRHRAQHRPTNRRRRCRRPRIHQTATHPSEGNAPCTHKP